MRAARLQDALERLNAAIRDVESELAAMKAEHDALGSHIFVSRRRYQNVIDTKPRELSAQEQELLKTIAENVMEDIKRRRVLDDRTPRAVAKS